VHGAKINFSDLIPEINLFYEKVSATKKNDKRSLKAALHPGK
jgi:hypothetical protein